MEYVLCKGKGKDFRVVYLTEHRAMKMCWGSAIFLLFQRNGMFIERLFSG
jgi:hypothetical protein